MKCKRCGKEFKEYVEVCDECGYNFIDDKKIGKILDQKRDPSVSDNNKYDLIDFPILAFIFGLIGLIIPVFICSVLAMKFSKKPAKASLEPCSKLGYVFGIVGIVVSVLFVTMILIYFMG